MILIVIYVVKIQCLCTCERDRDRETALEMESKALRIVGKCSNIELYPATLTLSSLLFWMLGIEPRSLCILGKYSTTELHIPPRSVPFQIASYCAARKDFRLIVEFRVAQTNDAPSASVLRALDCRCKPPYLGFILFETVCLAQVSSNSGSSCLCP